MAKVELKHMHKSFGQVDIIKDVNLTIEHGEFCVLVGASFPAANANASPSVGRSYAIPRSFSLTSRSRISMRSCVCRCVSK